MAYLLICVRHRDIIFDFTTLGRDLGPVTFEDSAVGLALCRDPCINQRRYFVIRSITQNHGSTDWRPYAPNIRTQREMENQRISFQLIHLAIEYRAQMRLPANLAFCSFTEMLRSVRFRKNYVYFLQKYAKWTDAREMQCHCKMMPIVCDFSAKLPFLVEIKLEQVVMPVCNAWCSRMLGLVRKREQLEETMAWLSTLGGGFSSLGDYFITFSEKAGKLSVAQLQIAMEMGDPIMSAKCRLFYALSLMQQGRLRCSKYMIRNEFHFATHFKVRDQKLIDMCLGLWNKLKYFYSIQGSMKKQKGSNGFHGNIVCSPPRSPVDVRHYGYKTFHLQGDNQYGTELCDSKGNLPNLDQLIHVNEKS